MHIKVWEESTSTISTFTPYIPFSIHWIFTLATEITFEDANDNLQITTALEILKSLSFQTSLQYLPSLMSPPWNPFLEILQWLTLQDFKRLFSLPLWPLLSLLCSPLKHCYPLQVSFGPFFFSLTYTPWWVHIVSFTPWWVHIVSFTTYTAIIVESVFNLRTLSWAPYSHSQTPTRSLLNIQHIQNWSHHLYPSSPLITDTHLFLYLVIQGETYKSCLIPLSSLSFNQGAKSFIQPP